MERHFYINESGIKSGPFTIGEMKQKQLDSNSTVMDSIVGEWMPSTKFDFNSISDDDYDNTKNSTMSNAERCVVCLLICNHILGSCVFISKVFR